MVRWTWRARAGSRRGSIATTTRSASTRPAAVSTAVGPVGPHLHVRRGGAGQHRDPAVGEPLGEQPGQEPHPAGDRPGAEVLLEVVDQPEPLRHVARVVPALDRVVPGEDPQPLVLEPLLGGAVERAPGAQQRLGLPGGDAGGPRRSSQSRRSRSQASPWAWTWSTHCRPAPASESASTASSWAARLPEGAPAGCRRRTGAPASARPGRGRAPSPAVGPTCGRGRAARRAVRWRAVRRPSGSRPARRSRSRRRPAPGARRG